jgi:hypothetical protein
LKVALMPPPVDVPVPKPVVVQPAMIIARSEAPAALIGCAVMKHAPFDLKTIQAASRSGTGSLSLPFEAACAIGAPTGARPCRCARNF